MQTESRQKGTGAGEEGNEVYAGWGAFPPAVGELEGGVVAYIVGVQFLYGTYVYLQRCGTRKNNIIK